MSPFRIVFDAIRWVRDHQVRHGARKQRLHEVRIPAVAAGDAMGSEQPDIAGLRYRNVRDVRDLILVRQPRLYPRKGDRQFLGRKAQRRKVSAHTREIRELKVEHFGVPAGIQGDPVIAAGYPGRLIAGEEVGVKAINLLRQCLNSMGATPSDASRVRMPVEKKTDPADKYS
jgi:hypothetical protein